MQANTFFVTECSQPNFIEKDHKTWSLGKTNDFFGYKTKYLNLIKNLVGKSW